MQMLPAIGSRVHSLGNAVTGSYEGVVIKHFPDFDETTLRQKRFDPATWHICVKVPRLPTRWPYNGDTIAPAVEDVELV